MGTGLYDAVFAALGRMYGHAARGPIADLTLFGGFASTVCWPLSARLIELAGWRGACLIYAALHLLRGAAAPDGCGAPTAGGRCRPRAPRPPTRGADAPAAAHETRIVVLLALVQSIAAGIGSIVVVHLLIFLQARGVDFAPRSRSARCSGRRRSAPAWSSACSAPATIRSGRWSPPAP